MSAVLLHKNYERVALMTESQKLLQLIRKCRPSKQINKEKNVVNDTRIKFDIFKLDIRTSYCVKHCV
jgi:hypothetical protein